MECGVFVFTNLEISRLFQACFPLNFQTIYMLFLTSEWLIQILVPIMLAHKLFGCIYVDNKQEEIS